MPEISNNIITLQNEKTSDKADPCNEKYSFCFCKISCSFLLIFVKKKKGKNIVIIVRLSAVAL